MLKTFNAEAIVSKKRKGGNEGWREQEKRKGRKKGHKEEGTKGKREGRKKGVIFSVF